MLTNPNRLVGLVVGGSMTGIAILLAVTFAGIAAASGIGIATWGWGLASISMGVIALSVGYQTLCLLSMAYAVTEGKLLIRWGPRTVVVPVQDITRTLSGRELNVPLAPRSLWWPGHYRCDGRIIGVGQTHYYCTSRSKGNLLVVITPHESFAISPPDIAAFQAALDQERARNIASQPEVRYWPIAKLAFWTDAPLQLLALGCLGITLLSLAVMLLQYPGLPEALPTRFNALGQPTIIQEKADVLRIVLGALGASIAAIAAGLFVHMRDRVAAYLAIAGGMGVQVLFFIATLRIVL